MKKQFIILISFVSILISSCFHAYIEPDAASENAVLLLQVDYMTNEFEEGKIIYVDSSDGFTLRKEEVFPSDFGSVSLYYDEVNALLFSGTSIWMGTGERTFPTDFTPALWYDRVITSDYVFPSAGFEIIPSFVDSTVYGAYEPAWSSVQSLVVARQFLAGRPSASVKIYLYAPSLGSGDPNTWKWLFFIKN